MKIVVGSTNPAKLEAVKRAFINVYLAESIDVLGVSVDSGVSKQPMSDEESVTGAINRAKQALQIEKADFGVGLEGGLQKVHNRWFDCGWVAVIDKNGTIGIGCSARIETPEKMMKLIRVGKELGEVDDMVFGKENSKQDTGHFGLMTNDALTRANCYRDAVIAALARFIKSDVFNEVSK